jgi:hypothetical protein
VTAKLVYCLDSVNRLRDQDHVGFCFDNRGQPLPEDRVIFDTQDANLFAGRQDDSPSLGAV